MALTSLNPNLLGTDSSGASKLSSAGGLVQLHSTGQFTVANTTANNISIANTGAVTLTQGLTSNTLTVSTNTATVGTSLYVIANGNVGIANSTPANPLVVRSSNAHIYMQQDNTDHGSIIGGASADGNFRIYRKDDSGVNERFRIETGGQPYHNQSYLFGTSYNAYHAKSTTSINVVSSAWTDTTLTWSNVFIPTNTRKVYLWFHLTLRNNGVNLNHTAFRIRVSNGNYVGDGSWGFGISQYITSSSVGHTVCSQFVNLLDYDGNGNQASLAAGNTYTFYLQAYDAYGSGGNLRLAAESSGTHQSYTPQHGTIWVL
jgi:hypothetical protein